MKAYGGVDVQIHVFSTSALVGGEWSASCPGGFPPPREEPPDIHWIGGWVGPRTGLDEMERRKFFTLPGLELRPLGPPARSQSLYQGTFFFFSFSGWGETESTWYVGQYLAYCTSPG
jgi:hypothetical protein